MLLNKKNVKTFALYLAKEKRAQKFTRVSTEFLERADFALKQWILREVESHPSIGKTLK